MKKFSHTGGVLGRRSRALERLKRIEEPTDNHLEEIEILNKKIQRKS